MVAPAKEARKEAFAKLLDAELDRVGIPHGRQRIGAVFSALKVKGKPLVSREQIRKWIRGIDIPDQANLLLVCDLLKLDWVRLQTGKASPPVPPLLVELQSILSDLPEPEQREIVRYAKYIREEADNNDKARPEGASEGERAALQRRASI